MGSFITDAAQKEEIVGGKSVLSLVINYITDAVMSKKLRAGDKIPTEIALCKELNVSRSTVREAIKTLAALGIVEVKRGFGTYISSSKTVFSTAPILYKMILLDTSRKECLDFRNQIEQSVIRLCAIHAEPQDIEALEASIEDMKEFVAAGGAANQDALLQKDIAFHKILAHSTKNVLMEEIYNLTLDLLMPMIKGQDGISAIKGHTLLLDAVRSGDVGFINTAVTKVIYEFWSIWVCRETEMEKNSEI